MSLYIRENSYIPACVPSPMATVLHDSPDLGVTVKLNNAGTYVDIVLIEDCGSIPVEEFDALVDRYLEAKMANLK